jgi:hypothetical protein
MNQQHKRGTRLATLVAAGALALTPGIAAAQDAPLEPVEARQFTGAFEAVGDEDVAGDVTVLRDQDGAVVNVRATGLTPGAVTQRIVADDVCPTDPAATLEPVFSLSEEGPFGPDVETQAEGFAEADEQGALEFERDFTFDETQTGAFEDLGDTFTVIGQGVDLDESGAIDTPEEGETIAGCAVVSQDGPVDLQAQEPPADQATPPADQPTPPADQAAPQAAPTPQGGVPAGYGAENSVPVAPLAAGFALLAAGSVLAWRRIANV